MMQLMMRMTTIGMEVMVVMFLARSNNNRVPGQRKKSLFDSGEAVGCSSGAVV